PLRPLRSRRVDRVAWPDRAHEGVLAGARRLRNRAGAGRSRGDWRSTDDRDELPRVHAARAGDTHALRVDYGGRRLGVALDRRRRVTRRWFLSFSQELADRGGRMESRHRRIPGGGHLRATPLNMKRENPAPESTPSALELRDIRKNFGATPIIRGVSLAIRSGERHAIIGPNGAGKSTLFNLISGRFAPTTGSIRL